MPAPGSRPSCEACWRASECGGDGARRSWFGIDDAIEARRSPRLTSTQAIGLTRISYRYVCAPRSERRDHSKGSGCGPTHVDRSQAPPGRCLTPVFSIGRSMPAGSRHVEWLPGACAGPDRRQRPLAGHVLPGERQEVTRRLGFPVFARQHASCRGQAGIKRAGRSPGSGTGPGRPGFDRRESGRSQTPSSGRVPHFEHRRHSDTRFASDPMACVEVRREARRAPMARRCQTRLKIRKVVVPPAGQPFLVPRPSPHEASGTAPR